MPTDMSVAIDSGYPLKGEKVIRVGEMLFINWTSADMSDSNIILFKGNEKVALTNKQVSDGQNGISIFIDNAFFTEEFFPCKIRVEMKQSKDMFMETESFKVLRDNDKGA